MTGSRWRVAAWILLTASGLLLGERVWLTAKAVTAQVLIDRAFDAHLADGGQHLPWAWADTHPVARLAVPRLGVRQVVLAGATGSSMAFGPGHLDGTARPNAPGNAVIAGHRDTVFAFLQRLVPGDAVQVETRDGSVGYRVSDLAVRSMWDPRIARPTAGRQLTLVTCHPFGGLTWSDERYVVTLIEADPAQGNSTASRRMDLRRNG